MSTEKDPLLRDAELRRNDPVFGWGHHAKLHPSSWDGRPDYGPPATAELPAIENEAEFKTDEFSLPREWTPDGDSEDGSEI